ncbi:MAG: DUF4193 family protein [Actinomycetota bacterium]
MSSEQRDLEDVDQEQGLFLTAEAAEELEEEDLEEEEEVPGGDDEDDDESEQASLDELSAQRASKSSVDGSEDDDDDDFMSFVPEPSPQMMEAAPARIAPVRERQEFVCKRCHLVKPRVQLADARRRLCRDCN